MYKVAFPTLFLQLLTLRTAVMQVLGHRAVGRFHSKVSEKSKLISLFTFFF